MWKFFLLTFLFNVSFLKAKDLEALKELTIITDHTLQMGENSLDYQAVLGRFHLKNADLVYTAYFLKGENVNKRPLMFCFNGGPGAASVWLNTGFVGPKKLFLNSLHFNSAPYELVDNPDTLLQVADLVFIDPVATGVSEIAAGRELKQFLGVEEEIELLKEFIIHFTIKNKKWLTPKFLMGESYGGIRALKLAYALQEAAYDCQGLLLISPVLDMQTIACVNNNNNLPYSLYFPSYAAAAFYHQKLDPKQFDSLEKVLREAENFASHELAIVLFQGDFLQEDSRKKIAEKMGNLIGISPELILANDFRLTPYRFMKNLLSQEKLLIGRFDARFTGADPNPQENYLEYDPSYASVISALTATFNQYLITTLKWPEEKPYRALASLPNWNWGKGNQYVEVQSEIKSLLSYNPSLQIFIADGLYDLAIPYTANRYTLSQLYLQKAAKKRVKHFNYPGGHMIYYDFFLSKKLARDTKDFIKQTLKHDY